MYYNDNATYQELAELANISVQTIHEDINKINEFIKPLYIDTQSQYECQLVHQYELTIDHIYSCIKKIVLSFNFLKKYFLNNIIA